MLQVVHEEFGIVEGLMTTVHATTGIQSLCAPNSFSVHTILHCYDNVVVFNIQQHKRLLMALQWRIGEGVEELAKISSLVQLVLQRYEREIAWFIIPAWFLRCRTILVIKIKFWFLCFSYRLLEKFFQNSTENLLEWHSVSLHPMFLLWI